MNSKKIFLILLISLLIKKKKKKEEKKDNNTQEPEKVVYDELPVDNVNQYFINLDFYAALAYDDGKCKGDYVNGNECTFTLNQLKKEVDYEDLSSLDTYLGKQCNGDIISVTIDLNKLSEEGISTTHTIDESCMPNENIK